MKTIRVIGGDSIYDLLKRAYLLSLSTGDTVSFTHNKSLYVADAANKNFTVRPITLEALEFIAKGIRSIPTYTDPELDALRVEVERTQAKLQILHQQIANRVNTLTGKV